MSSRTIAARVALAAALLPLAAGCSDDEPAEATQQDGPSVAADRSSAPAADLPEGILALPARGPGEDSVSLAAGRYRIPLDDSLAFDVDLPTDTSAHDDGLFLATDSFILKTELAGDQYGVPRDPCTDQTIVPTGPTVDDLVQALTTLPAYQVSPPQPVDLGGAHGTYLEARIPAGYDDTKCDGSAIQLPGNPDTAVSGPAPYTGHWWILDVDGRRVVVQQNCWGCSKKEFARAPEAPQSITFTPAP
ncbi:MULTISPECIES: hypothetical protein [unclassified Nocardioides]|jgi:hypothetical protein|uniref:hypothetical protein n=1 Tax=unclassified Nocardioides TaxID=2615069 RepID=UPI00114EE594|nr:MULTISPECIES: hypothetical protein [unclassified Nocardioides]TQK72134.1 hypothetical protein FBY23_3944 [Nocardioides sp. SLBN-35]WGY03648.1 hypothetical protein QI633_07745 [Nocardioides sp. QY071]